jgi:hypothetical protein
MEPPPDGLLVHGGRPAGRVVGMDLEAPSAGNREFPNQFLVGSLGRRTVG